MSNRTYELSRRYHRQRQGQSAQLLPPCGAARAGNCSPLAEPFRSGTGHAGDNPQRCGIAPENDAVDEEIRQFLFGRRPAFSERCSPSRRTKSACCISGARSWTPRQPKNSTGKGPDRLPTNVLTFLSASACSIRFATANLARRLALTAAYRQDRGSLSCSRP